MFRLTVRNLLARKVRLIMSTLAIVLGVGFLTGVLTFSGGLGSTFDGIIKGSTADGLVRPEGAASFETTQSGPQQVLTPREVERIAAVPEVAAADGGVDGTGAFLLDSDDKLVGGQGAPTLAFNVTDTDNVLDKPMLTLDEGRWPESTDEIAVDSSSVDRAGYEVGDTVRVIVPGAASVQESTRELTLVGKAGFNGGGVGGATLLLFDTDGAQQVFLGGKDVYTSVMLTAAEGVSEQEMADAVQRVLPGEFEAVTGEKVISESQDAMSQFLDVISTFLIVFAVIAIIVGGFIIANTFSILVAQRVRELALLRALGASAKQVRRTVLLEAVLMALVGSSLGILLGTGLARGLAALFTSIGLEIKGDALSLTPTTILAAYAVGLAVTLVSAYLPARRASRTAPVAAMREEQAPTDGSLRRRALIGALVIAIGALFAVAGLVGAPGNDAVYIGVAAVLWIFTAAAISPVLGHPLLVGGRRLFGGIFGTPGRLAGENALRNPRRTGATAAALMIGLALVAAVGTLAASMSSTTDAIVEEQFASDFLVQSPTFQSFSTTIGDEMEQVDGVGVLSRDQFGFVTVDGTREAVLGVEETFPQIYELDMVEGTDRISGREALLTTDKAEDLGVGVGDELELGFIGGRSVTVTVAGTFEPTEVVGGLNVPREVLTQLGMRREDSSISINLEEGADASAVEADLEEVVADLPIVTVQDKDEFADSLKGQINQLLYMIYGLLALAIVIAIVGIVNTLGLSIIERTREIGLLRAVGLSRAQLRRMVTLESVTISVMGALLGMGLGLVVGVLLRQSLADDLTELSLPLTSLVVFLVISVVCGVLAAVVPAIRASRLKVLDAIASE